MSAIRSVRAPFVRRAHATSGMYALRLACTRSSRLVRLPLGLRGLPRACVPSDWHACTPLGLERRPFGPRALPCHALTCACTHLACARPLLSPLSKKSISVSNYPPYPCVLLSFRPPLPCGIVGCALTRHVRALTCHVRALTWNVRAPTWNVRALTVRPSPKSQFRCPNSPLMRSLTWPVCTLTCARPQLACAPSLVRAVSFLPSPKSNVGVQLPPLSVRIAVFLPSTSLWDSWLRPHLACARPHLCVPSLGMCAPSLGMCGPSLGMWVPSLGTCVPSLGMWAPSLVRGLTWHVRTLTCARPHLACARPPLECACPLRPPLSKKHCWCPTTPIIRAHCCLFAFR